MRLPALFWGLALTENVDCITGSFDVGRVYYLVAWRRRLQ